MKGGVTIVSRHLPVTEGSAAGRALLATVRGLRHLGVHTEVWSWSPEPPPESLPPGVEWRPLPSEPMWRTRLRSLVRPRSDVERAGWIPPRGRVVIADEPLSWPAVRRVPRAAVTLHYATAIDAAALGRTRPRDWQDRRAERRAARAAPLVLTYSERVAALARRSGARATAVVPIPLTVPISSLPVVETPTAVLLADRRWEPNLRAIDRLIRLWPSVRRRVPGARLVLAGRGPLALGSVPGVEDRGEVEHAEDVLAEAACLAFPCPPTSGPKVKVLESVLAGLPVVTTPWGLEGLAVPEEEVWVAPSDRFVEVLVACLSQPGRRGPMAGRARQQAAAAHAPEPSASVRLTALSSALGVESDPTPQRRHE